MNTAVIFAGGSGTRMNSKDKPKQFLLIHGKPIIVHTIEVFQNHPDIDAIVVVCIEDWIDYMEELKFRYRLEKIRKIVPGGATGQLSIFNGLEAAEEISEGDDDIVLIHDGVRPLITPEELTLNIESVKAHGSAITCVKTKETFVLVNDDNKVLKVPDRAHSFVAKAPQSFLLKDIISAQRKAISEGFTNMIDSCTLMQHYGYETYCIIGNYENMKITTPDDFYTFRALYDARENQQLNF